jgi:hypothetical protein
MLPVKPAVESVTVVVPLCAKAGIEKEHEPLVVDAAAQGAVVDTQLDPE